MSGRYGAKPCGQKGAKLYRWAAVLLFWLMPVLLSAAANAAPASGEAQEPTFDLQHAPALLEQFADPEKALAADPQKALQYWNSFLTTHQLRLYSGQSMCGVQIRSGLDSPSGLSFSLEITRGPAPECGREVSNAAFSATLKDSATASALRGLLEQRFGPSDPKCSNEKFAFWSLRSGYSLRWTLFSPTFSEIALFAADPPDTNCSISSVAETPKVNQAQLEAFFTQFRDGAPSWFDPVSMERLLSAYGPVKRDQTGKCLTNFYLHSAGPGLSGVERISGTAIAPECRDDSSVSGDGRLVLGIIGKDMFAETKFRNALTAVYGKRYMPCAEDVREIWKLSDRVFIFLVPDMLPPGPILLAATVPPGMLECMRQ